MLQEHAPKISELFTSPKSQAVRRAKSWYEGRLAQGQKQVFAEVVNLTPEMAEVLVGNNPENRMLSDGTAARYAAAMKRGAWQLNGQPMIVAKTGELNDGQHRCHGCVLSGMAILTVVVWGVERETRATLDQGRKRTNGDHLHMQGYKNSMYLATAAKLVFFYDEEKERWGSQPDADQILETVRMNPELSEHINPVMAFSKEYSLTAGYMAAVRYLCVCAHPIKAQDFFDKLTTGLGITRKNDPIAVLRKRFLSHASGKEPMEMLEQAAVTVKTWNAWMAKRNIKNLSWRRRGESPEKFPRVS